MSTKLLTCRSTLRPLPAGIRSFASLQSRILNVDHPAPHPANHEDSIDWNIGVGDVTGEDSAPKLKDVEISENEPNSKVWYTHKADAVQGVDGSDEAMMDASRFVICSSTK
jgi:hypothetical protein